MYVSTFTMTGIIGVALLIWAYLAAFVASRRRLLSNSTFVAQAAVLFMVLLALDLTYFVGYSSGAISGLILGLACGITGIAIQGPASPGRDTSEVSQPDEPDIDTDEPDIDPDEADTDQADTDEAEPDEAPSAPAEEWAPARSLMADPFPLLTGPESSPPAQS